MVPDYYERLELSADATSAEIESALRKKQPAWSMGTRNPKTRHTNQRYLDEIPSLRTALLSGQAQRDAYDAELGAAQAARDLERLDDLDRLVRLRAAKGGLSAADRELLRNEATRLGVSSTSLDRIMQPIPFLVEQAIDGEGPESVQASLGETLDSSTRRQIRTTLDHLDRRDLYDALGLFRDAPIAVIAARADEERQRWMKKAQVTAEKTAWLEVVSLAQTHLGGSKARARYDRTLTLEAEERFEAMAAFAVRGLSRVDPGTHVALVNEAGAMGIPPDRARPLIIRACRKEGVAAETPTPQVKRDIVSPHRVLRCRDCAGVTEMSPSARGRGAARCKHCGASLRWDCPVCRRSHLMDVPRCKCGFRQSLREPLIQQFTAALHAYRSHDLSTARRHLEIVQQYAPQHVGARNGMARIAEREQEIDQLRMAVELAEAGGRCFQAMKSLNAWRRRSPLDSKEIADAQARLAEKLRRAEAFAARARRQERSDPSEARRLYRASLASSCDLPSALLGLERCPPDAPTNLDARIIGDRIRLTWIPPAPDGLSPVSFVVLRKMGALPTHPADGVRIIETLEPEYEDAIIEPGEPVSYAVLSRRGDVDSLAAVAAGPLVPLPDVRHLLASARDGTIVLTWEPPQGAAEIRVVRGIHAAPRTPGDGDRIPAAHDSAVDRTVYEGQVYHYAVFAIYRTSEERRFPSSGVAISVQASPPAATVGPPRIKVDSTGRIVIEWSEPAHGVVRLRRSNAPLALTPGEAVVNSDVEAMPGDWIEPVEPGRAEDFDPLETSARYYTPFTALNGELIAGQGAVVARLVDPSDLRAVRLNPTADAPNVTRLQLRWTWPPETLDTRITARRGKSPDGPDDPAALRLNVSRREYDQAGGWILHAPAPIDAEQGDSRSNNHWHVRAFSMELRDGEASFSPGLETSAETVAPGPHPEITLSYQFKKPWLPGRPWTLTVRTEPPGAEVPPLIVVANSRTVPISVEDGELMSRLPAGVDGATHSIPANPQLVEPGVRVFVDPSRDPNATPPIRVRHPEYGTTRV